MAWGSGSNWFQAPLDRYTRVEDFLWSHRKADRTAETVGCGHHMKRGLSRARASRISPQPRSRDRHALILSKQVLVQMDSELPDARRMIKHEHEVGHRQKKSSYENWSLCERRH